MIHFYLTQPAEPSWPQTILASLPKYSAFPEPQPAPFKHHWGFSYLNFIDQLKVIFSYPSLNPMEFLAGLELLGSWALSFVPD
jgi:hypothetical protein